MKYVIFSQRCDVHYGAQIHVETIFDEFVRNKREASLLFITWSKSGRLIDYSAQNGINFYCIGILATLKLLIFNRLDGYRFDGIKIFTHGSLAGYFFSVLRLFHRRNIHVHTLHGTPLSRLRFTTKNKFINFLFKSFERLIYSNSHLIFCSDSDFQDYQNIKVRALSLKVIRYYRGEKLNLDLKVFDSDKCRFVFVAGFRNQKRQLDLLRILANNLSNTHSLHFTFIGGGPLLNECIQIKEKFKMSNVVFTGYQSPMVVSEILCKSHYGILLSNFEGQPLSAIEYLKYGLPLLVNSANGLGELVVNNGLLLDYNFSDNDLMSSFDVLQGIFFNDRKTYLDLRNNSLNVFETHFAKQNTIEEFFEFYVK